MELKEQPGGTLWTVHAPIWDPDSPTLNGRDHLLIGISQPTLQMHAQRGLRHFLGQLYGIVSPGLITARYLFQGLKRGMMVGDDAAADQQKLAAAWLPNRDAVLVGGPQNCRLDHLPLPDAAVFVVYISPNRMLDEFPHIYGWAEHWAWVAADNSLAGAPVSWETRYDKPLWAAPGAECPWIQ